MLSEFLQVVGVLSKPQLNEIAGTLLSVQLTIRSTHLLLSFPGSVNSIDQVFQSNFLIAAQIQSPNIGSYGEYQYDALISYGIENCTSTDARFFFSSYFCSMFTLFMLLLRQMGVLLPLYGDDYKDL